MGQQSPGYCEILNLNAPRRLRIQAGPGFDGAAIAFGGFETQEFTLKIHLYTDQDWIDWHVFKQLLTKSAAKTQKVGNSKVERALDIYHPFLADPLFNISSIVIKDVVGPNPNGDSGEWIFEIKCVSALKMKPSYAKVEGSKEAPLDARDRAIQDNSNRIGKNSDTLAALKNQKVRAPK